MTQIGFVGQSSILVMDFLNEILFKIAIKEELSFFFISQLKSLTKLQYWDKNDIHQLIYQRIFTGIWSMIWDEFSAQKIFTK